MNDLNKIIYSEDLKNKCISLIDIYHEDRMIYTNSQLNSTKEKERGRHVLFLFYGVDIFP